MGTKVFLFSCLALLGNRLRTCTHPPALHTTEEEEMDGWENEWKKGMRAFSLVCRYEESRNS